MMLSSHNKPLDAEEARRLHANPKTFVSRAVISLPRCYAANQE